MTGPFGIHVDETTLDLLIGSVLPPLIGIIQQPKWPSWFKALVTVAICAGVGTLRVYLSENVAAMDYISVTIRIIIAAMATYESFWKHTGAKAIEAMTSVQPLTEVSEDAP